MHVAGNGEKQLLAWYIRGILAHISKGSYRAYRYKNGPEFSSIDVEQIRPLKFFPERCTVVLGSSLLGLDCKEHYQFLWDFNC